MAYRSADSMWLSMARMAARVSSESGGVKLRVATSYQQHRSGIMAAIMATILMAKAAKS